MLREQRKLVGERSVAQMNTRRDPIGIRIRIRNERVSPCFSHRGDEIVAGACEIDGDGDAERVNDEIVTRSPRVSHVASL